MKILIHKTGEHFGFGFFYNKRSGPKNARHLIWGEPVLTIWFGPFYFIISRR
jgi:hypothetical protein